MAIRDLILSQDPALALQEIKIQWTEMAGVVNDVLNHLTVDRAGLLTSDTTKTKDLETNGNPARGAAAPTQVFLNNVSGWRFAVSDEIYFNFAIPEDYKPGTDLTFELHFYSANTTAARYVRFTLDWQAIAIGEVVTAPGSSGSIDSADILLATTANQFSSKVFTVIPGASLSASDHINLRLIRTASVGTAPASPADNPVMVHFEISYTAYVTSQ